MTDAIRSVDNPYDVVIVGGGIQGAGVARDAACRGLSVLLCEQADFANATSSNSSKLIHGGLRYLEKLEIPLVYESLHERAALMRTARHLVRPLNFTIPLYRKSRRPAWLFRIGLWLYDVLAGRQPLPAHRVMAKDELGASFPYLRHGDLNYALQYSDCQMDDARLVIANITDACAHGAHCLNYTPVKDIRNNTDGTYTIDILHNGQQQSVSSRVVVNAGGPWVDSVQDLVTTTEKNNVKLAKGVHLVLSGDMNVSQALLLQAEGESRVFFVMPWGNAVLVGTTDTVYKGSPGDVSIDKEDFVYLWRNLKKYIEPEVLQSMRVISCFAGVRPLVFRANTSTREISRGYKIDQPLPRLWNIIGGKYTVYRKIGEKVVDQIMKTLQRRKACATAETLLPGATADNWLQFMRMQSLECQRQFQVEASVAQHIVSTYGTRWPLVLESTKQDQALKKVLSPHFPHIGAEVVYAIEHEFARTFTDFMVRRTRIFHSASGGLECLDWLGQLFAKTLGLDAAAIDEMAQEYRQQVDKRNQLLIEIQEGIQT